MTFRSSLDRKTNITRTAQLIVLVGLLLSSINPSAAQQTGKVQISCLNLNEEIVPFIDVIIEGNGIRRELKTVGVGDEYESGGLVELPIGIYRVTSRKGNYFDFRRAPFRVRAGIVTRINVYPLRFVRVQTRTSERTDRYELEPKPAYDLYSITHAPDKALKMLVRYDKKRRSGEFVEYEGRFLAQSGVASAVDSGVMVTYDALAIYADRIRFDRKKLTLMAQGFVTVEDGTQRIKAKTVTVRFNNGTPEVAIDANP